MHFIFTGPRYHTNQHYAVKALLDAGHQVTFLALTKGQSEVYDSLEPSILPESAVMRGLGIGAPSPHKLWHSLRRLDPDVVIVRDPNTALGFLSFALTKLMRRPVVFYTQTLMHRRLSWRQKLARSTLARLTGARWITPVLGSPGVHPPAFGALRYVPFVMEPQTCPEQKQWFDEGEINLISVGKFQGRKQHRMFLQAVAHLVNRYPVRATVIGECTTMEHQSELRELRDLRSSLGLCGRVDFKTNLPYWDVQTKYARHDLFVLPSRDEPAAVSLLEAMSHSLPVICSDSNGTQCYIRHGENGYVFETDNLADLIDCMECIVSDRDRLTAMGAQSYHLVLSQHSPAKYVENIASIAEGRE